MMAASGVNISAAQSLNALEKAPGVPRVQKPEEEAAGRPLKPAMDEYIPEEKREPSGRYWIGRDEDGQPKIYFDDPDGAADVPERPENTPDAKKPDEEAPGAKKSERKPGTKGPAKKGEKGERCVGNTDKVDRELEKLKKKQKDLEQRLNTETDGARRKNLEQQLAQVERELREKDNDAYRKQHSTFTQL